ncbi:UNVERIFIED_CONTAM: cytochrome [Sesamum latifolium]|uniref:Cytochrome n=1 Tax=Sesamum latifolium TaxID=2727402 RepID=A0AAW2WNR0_9LAMI
MQQAVGFVLVRWKELLWVKVETGLLPVLASFCKQGAEVDLQDIFQRFTFDNICKVVLDYDCIELPHIPCEKAFSDSVKPLLLRHVVPESIWKLQKRLKIGREKQPTEASQNFDDFIYPLVSLKNGEQENDANLLTVFRKC